MSYRDVIVRLGDATEQKVLGIYRQFVAGQLTREETVALMAQTIAVANSRAVAVADLSLASTLMLELGVPVETVGVVRPPWELERLHKASTTVLQIAEASAVPEAIIGRLARSEPLESGIRAYSEGMKSNPRVKGWVRQRSPGSCQLCEWWHRDGRVWPADHPMPTHQGCTCTPKPVLQDEIQSTGYTRSLHNA